MFEPFAQLIKNIVVLRLYADSADFNGLQQMLLKAISDPLLFFVVSIYAIIWSHIFMPFNLVISSVPTSEFTPEFCGSLLCALSEVYSDPDVLLDNELSWCLV